jgi:hypothetical protein
VAVPDSVADPVGEMAGFGPSDPVGGMAAFEAVVALA